MHGFFLKVCPSKQGQNGLSYVVGILNGLALHDLRCNTQRAKS